MNELIPTSEAFEEVYTSAISLQSLIEQLVPGEKVTEESWFLCVQMSRRLTAEVDLLRANLLKLSRQPTATQVGSLATP